MKERRRHQGNLGGVAQPGKRPRLISEATGPWPSVLHFHALSDEDWTVPRPF